MIFFVDFLTAKYCSKRYTRYHNAANEEIESTSSSLFPLFPMNTMNFNELMHNMDSSSLMQLQSIMRRGTGSSGDISLADQEALKIMMISGDDRPLHQLRDRDRMYCDLMC